MISKISRKALWRSERSMNVEPARLRQVETDRFDSNHPTSPCSSSWGTAHIQVYFSYTGCLIISPF